MSEEIVTVDTLHKIFVEMRHCGLGDFKVVVASGVIGGMAIYPISRIHDCGLAIAYGRAVMDEGGQGFVFIETPEMLPSDFWCEYLQRVKP